MYSENFPLAIWLFLIIERPTHYMRKHPRTPYAPMSARRDLRILDSFVILVDYFALFVKT